MVLVNFYIVEHAYKAIPAYAFSQTFFYSVSQLVMDMEITNTNDKMPNDIRDCWDRFKTQYPSAIFTQASIRGYANSLARVCQTLQTTYSNMIVEHFQDRVEKFVIFKLRRLMSNISNNLARKLDNEHITKILPEAIPQYSRSYKKTDLDIILAIHTIQISLKDYIPEPCTTTEMAANPGRFIPALRFILSQYTLEHEQGNEKTCKTLPKLCALTPQPSLHWRFVDIDAATLATLLHLETTVTHQQKTNTSKTVLDFNLYRFFNSEECMFTNRVTTNGFQLSLHFAKPAKSPGMEIELSDFKEEEIENYFMPCALDPGRRNIFQAAYGAQNTEHEIRRSSTTEYYQWTGSPERNENLKKARKRNSIEEIESNFPSAKTADITRYSEYVRYLFLHLETLFTFYCFDKDAER